jgi:hypothetical protein
LSEPLWRLIFLAEPDRACGKMDQTRHAGVAIHLHYAIAGELCSAIDAEDSHGRSLLHFALPSDYQD